MNVDGALKRIKSTALDIKIMEVCGTHTASIYKNGIKDLLAPGITLVSGPGCPVCVTVPGAIDNLVAYSMRENTVVLSFGDMFKVRGSAMSLSGAKAAGGRARLIYSPFDAVRMAKEDEKSLFIIAAVGFETTSPVYAALIERLIREKITNVKLYTALKTMPEAIDYVCRAESVGAFICPGHVSVIIGSGAYAPLCEKYKKPFVIAGFEAAHIIAAIDEIIVQKEKGLHKVVNLYQEAVSDGGQPLALAAMAEFFEKSSARWRGIGEIENSGYVIKKEYSRFSANVEETDFDRFESGCQCADVILGRAQPSQCPLFGRVCNPHNPVGACMVSSEGACGIEFGNRIPENR